MQIKVNNVEKQIYLTPTLRKTENIYSEDYFQYNDFAALRKKFLTPITDACISSTFSEIRDLISTIKDLTPSPLPPSPPSLYFKKIEKNISNNKKKKLNKIINY